MAPGVRVAQLSLDAHHGGSRCRLQLAVEGCWGGNSRWGSPGTAPSAARDAGSDAALGTQHPWLCPCLAGGTANEACQETCLASSILFEVTPRTPFSIKSEDLKAFC